MRKSVKLWGKQNQKVKFSRSKNHQSTPLPSAGKLLVVPFRKYMTSCMPLWSFHSPSDISGSKAMWEFESVSDWHTDWLTYWLTGVKLEMLLHLKMNPCVCTGWLVWIEKRISRIVFASTLLLSGLGVTGRGTITVLSTWAQLRFLERVEWWKCKDLSPRELS